MTEYLLLLLGTALVNNVVLVKFLGLCPFMGVSNKLDSALGMGFATTFVLTLAAGAGWLLEHYVLEPLDIGFLRILTLILVIAAVVQFTEMVVRRFFPALYQVLGIFLPLTSRKGTVFWKACCTVLARRWVSPWSWWFLPGFVSAWRWPRFPTPLQALPSVLWSPVYFHSPLWAFRDSSPADPSSLRENYS